MWVLPLRDVWISDTVGPRCQTKTDTMKCFWRPVRRPEVEQGAASPLITGGTLFGAVNNLYSHSPIKRRGSNFAYDWACHSG
jgi:hypothetical protein